MSGTQRIGNARATNEWGEDRARARSGSTGKAELKRAGSQQASTMENWTNQKELSVTFAGTKAECRQDLELMGGSQRHGRRASVSCLNSRSDCRIASSPEYSIAVGHKTIFEQVLFSSKRLLFSPKVSLSNFLCTFLLENPELKFWQWLTKFGSRFSGSNFG